MKAFLVGTIALGSSLGFLGSPSLVRIAVAAPSGPVFIQNGQPTNLLVCGVPTTFDVPGQTQVWLTQWKSNLNIGNNQQTFDGPFTVPSTYTPNCVGDNGTFQNKVYTLVNGQKGDFLGAVEATIASSAQPTGGEVTIGEPLRTCFDHLAAVGGVLQSSDPTLSPGEWLIHVMNTQPAFMNNRITKENVTRDTLNQIAAALSSNGGYYYFNSQTCVGFRIDGVGIDGPAYGPNGYDTNWMRYPLNAHGCPSWWTGSDICSYATVATGQSGTNSGGGGSNSGGCPTGTHAELQHNFGQPYICVMNIGGDQNRNGQPGGSSGGGSGGSGNSSIQRGAACPQSTPCDQSFKTADGTDVWCRSINGSAFTYMALADLQPYKGKPFSYGCGGTVNAGTCTGEFDANGMPTCTTGKQ